MDINVAEIEPKVNPGLSDKNIKVASPRSAVQERIDIKQNLQKAFKSMLELLLQDMRGLQASEGKSVSFTLTPTDLSAGSKASLLGAIYALMLKAIFNHIYYFFDDEGRLVSLKDLDKLTLKKYGSLQNPCYEEISKHLKNYFHDHPLYSDDPSNPGEQALLSHIADLPLPTLDQNASVKERLCVGLLQRLYPIKNSSAPIGLPMESLVEFLCFYKELVSTEQLFKLIAHCLQLPEVEMPYPQKLRMLRLCDLWCESNIFYKDKALLPVQEAFTQLVDTCQRQDNSEIKDISEELQQRFWSNDMDFHLQRKDSLNTDRYLKKIILGDCESLWFDNFIDVVSTDIKLHAAQASSLALADDACKERSAGSYIEVESFNNKLVNYVNASFLRMKLMCLEGSEEGPGRGPGVRKLSHAREHDNEKLMTNFIGLFISLAHALAQKNDFLSAFAIYTTLSQSETGRAIEKLKNVKRKHKGSDRLFSVNDMLSRYEFLAHLFSPDNHFASLNAKIKECRSTGQFFVPVFAMLKMKAVLDAEKIGLAHSEADRHSEIPFTKLENKGALLWWINSLLQEVRMGLKHSLGTHFLQSDIGYHILRQSGSDET
jgi:hypothetical protein